MDSSGAVATGMSWHIARGLGSYGERMAARYLTERGLDVLDQNWRCDLGEIDIVARDGGCLVVCEVKTRRSTTFGQPIEAVDHRKLARLRRLAAAWLAERRAVGSPVPGVAGIRVDVVGVLRPRRGPCRIEHVVGAFS
jgi:putative endonuclease